MFHPNGKPTLDNVGPLIGMVEVEGIPLPMLKLRLDPHWKEIQVWASKLMGWA
jgi:hypothetical protein